MKTHLISARSASFTMVAAAFGSAFAMTPAMAASNDQQAIQIEYNDLNLSTPEGQERLEQRIDSAARRICQANSSRTGTRMNSQASNACFDEVRASARSKMATLVEEQQRGG